MFRILNIGAATLGAAWRNQGLGAYNLGRILRERLSPLVTLTRVE